MPAPALLRRLLARRPRTARRRRAHGGRSARRRARRALALAPVVFVLVLAGAWPAAEALVPEITDTEYHRRLAVVRARAADRPHNPLGLVMGSSRVVWGFRPEQLPEPEPGGVDWVNGAHVGGGPVLNRLMLHRYLRDGVRPAVVVVEAMPPFFVRENSMFVAGHFAVSELPLARRYGKYTADYEFCFLRHRVGRVGDLGRVFDPFAGSAKLLPRGGESRPRERMTPEERARRTAVARSVYRNDLARMVVRPAADRATRDMLAEAAARGVRVVFLRMPEGPTFRSWYDPAGAERFDAYLAGLAREFGTPVIDARAWVEDEEDFADSHHLVRTGADKFTARLARELPAALGR